MFSHSHFIPWNIYSLTTLAIWFVDLCCTIICAFFLSLPLDTKEKCFYFSLIIKKDDKKSQEKKQYSKIHFKYVYNVYHEYKKLYIHVYTDHNLPQGESKLKIESPFFKMQRQFVRFLAIAYSHSLLFFTKNLKPEKLGLLFWNLQE